MSILDGYRIVENVTGVPTMSVTKNGVAFNKSTLEKLRRADYVLALLNDQERKFMIITCNADEDEARRFYKGRKVSDGVRWNNRDLLDTLERVTGWDLEKIGWKIKGEFAEEGSRRAIIFNLFEAEPLDSSTRKGARFETTRE